MPGQKQSLTLEEVQDVIRYSILEVMDDIEDGAGPSETADHDIPITTIRPAPVGDKPEYEIGTGESGVEEETVHISGILPVPDNNGRDRISDNIIVSLTNETRSVMVDIWKEAGDVNFSTQQRNIIGVTTDDPDTDIYEILGMIVEETFDQGYSLSVTRKGAVDIYNAEPLNE